MLARSVTVTGLFILSLTAQTKPELTDTQKLKVREAQLVVANLDAQKARLEIQFREAAAVLSEAVKSVTPDGYVLQPDMKLTPKVEKK